MSVREIRGWAPATPLPHSPGYVRGVINLRGAVLSIVDLASRLGLPPTEPSARARHHRGPSRAADRRPLGRRRDGHPHRVTSDVIQPTPDVASDMARSFVTGVLAVDGRMISLITLDQVLPVPRNERLRDIYADVSRPLGRQARRRGIRLSGRGLSPHRRHAARRRRDLPARTPRPPWSILASPSGSASSGWSRSATTAHSWRKPGGRMSVNKCWRP